MDSGASWRPNKKFSLEIPEFHDIVFGMVKRTDTPRLTPSIRIALQDLGLARVAVIYPGPKRFPVAEQVEAVPVRTLTKSDRLFQGTSS